MGNGLRVDVEVGGRLGEVVGVLRGRGGKDKIVHEARKGVKGVRALLRLVREELGGKVYRRENRALSEAMRGLSAVRDAAALVELAGTLKGGGGLVRELKRRRGRLGREVLGDGLKEAAGAVEEVRGRVKQWNVKEVGVEEVRRGLVRTYKKGRKAMAGAVETGEDEAWHTWRKRVKDLRYQVGEVGGMVVAMEEGLHRLGDLLGEDHDLAVLLGVVLGKDEDKDEDKDKELNGRGLVGEIGRRRVRLKREAVRLGGALYREKVGAFRRRVGGG